MDDTSGSGGDVNEHPIKKCPSVNVLKSDGSEEIVVRSLELRTALILHNNILVSSYVKRAPLLDLTRCCFANFTADSQNPLKCEAEGGMNCHSILNCDS